jgi:hypothetical protein
LTGATGMTTPAFDNTASTATGRKFGVRSMEGIDTLFQLVGPLRLLWVVDVPFITTDLGGYLGLFSNSFEKARARQPQMHQIPA